MGKKSCITEKDKMDLEPIIIDKLLNTKGKNCIKIVANELGIDPNFIRHIYKTRKIGLMKQTMEQVGGTFNDMILEPDKLLGVIELKDNLTSLDDTSSIITTEDIILDTNPGASLPKRTRNSIPDDVKIAVALEYEQDKNATYKSLAEKYNISAASVGKIITDIGGYMPRKKKSARKVQSSKRRTGTTYTRVAKPSTTTKRLEKELVKKPDPVVKEVPKVEEPKPVSMPTAKISETLNVLLSTYHILEKVRDNTVKAGLCSDRHEIPADKFIYDTFSEDELFNYDWQYNKAVEFIKTSVPNKVLHVYCTGIQCALASVIKACNDNKVTLSLFHYNVNDDNYRRQDIWKFEENSIDETKSCFSDLLKRGPVYTYTLGGEINPDEFYTVSINRANDHNDGFKEQSYVCCDTLDNAFKLYIDYVKAINEQRDKIKLAVFVTKTRIEKGKFTWDVNLTKSFNFK